MADTGDDRMVPRNTRVVLDGSASRDPEGLPLTYRWLLVASPASSAAALSSTTMITAEIVVDVPGTYDVSLVVNDGSRDSEPAVVRITVVDGLPVADAGDDQSVHWGITAHLDGSNSIDPDGESLAYAWTLTARPSGSAAVLTGATTATPSLATDKVGVYEARLVVNDGDVDSPEDVVVVTATNTAPTANAGSNSLVAVGNVVTLNGSGADADNDPVTFAWSVTSRPMGSTAVPSSPTTPSTTFTPDVAGNYVLSLAVSDTVATTIDTVVLLGSSGGGVLELGHDVVDAEYSDALERIVMVSDDRRALHVFDPVTRSEYEIALPLAPTAVSVSPSGMEAVVGHDGWLSKVTLSPGSVPITYPVSAPVLDIVHGGNGWAYVFPTRDQWQEIRCVDLTTGNETLGGGGIYAGTVGRKNPARPAIYDADNGLSPSDIELHDISAGPSVLLRDSPYHGDYAMCGNLWFSDDGNRIFTACGNVFRASENPAVDMTYNGNLAGAQYIGFVDHSDEANLVAVLPRNSWGMTGADNKIRFYEEQFLGFVSEVLLPPMVINQTMVATAGRFVFWRADGLQYYVVVRATPATGVVRTGIWVGTPP